MAKLGDICDIKSGGTPSRSKQEYWNGSIPWVKISDFNGKYIDSTSEKITEVGLNNSSAKIVEKGSILFTIFATLGEVAILNIDASTNQAIAALTINSSDININYLYYFLTSIKKYVNEIGRGVAQNNINMSILKNINVPLPPLEIQQQIADNLDKVTHIIDLCNAILEKLDLLVKSRFVEMFGDPVINPQKRDMTTIGEIVTEVKYGTSRPAVDGGKYPYLRMNNLTYDGHLDFTDLKRIDIPDNEIEKCIVHKGDVLFNRTNSIELVGKTCVFDEDEDMVIAGYIIRIRLKSAVLPLFLSCFMNTDFMKKKLRAMAKGAVNQANINAKELQEIDIYIPPLELQEQFADFVKQVDKSKLAVKQVLEKAEVLKNALMQEYFG